MWNNRPLFVRKKEMIAPGCYSRKYGMLGSINRQCDGAWVDATHRVVPRVGLWISFDLCLIMLEETSYFYKKWTAKQSFFLKSVLQGTKHQRDNFEHSTWASHTLHACVAREEKPAVFFAFVPSLTPPFHSHSTSWARVLNLGKNRGCIVVYVKKRVANLEL